jgi:hypothetical protein
MNKLYRSSTTVLAVSFMVLTLGLSGPFMVFAASPAAVNLGTAGNFAILSKTGISTTGVTSIVGDIGVSPAAATYITGFALTLPAAGAFSTSALVTGKVYAPGYANPTSANLTAAILDMQTAYTDAAGRAPDVTELGAGNIGGLTLAPGVYKWGTGLTIPTDVTLFGGANDVWVFQVAQALNISSAKKVVLAGGAQAKNIFWVVAGQTTIGTTAVFNGNILDQTAIVLNTGAKLNGRALAQTAVTLDSNAVIAPTSAASTAENPAVPATSSAPTSKTTVPATVTAATDPVTTATHADPVTTATHTTSDRATIATTATNTTDTDTGCLAGNKFSITTGRDCGSTVTTDAGCLAGNKFSITTGRDCGSTATTPPYIDPLLKSIAINLGTGSSGNEVKILQQFLISQNKGPDAQALAKVGDTGYFGVLTNAALAEFQAKAGISPALGNLGPITRAYLRANLP